MKDRPGILGGEPTFSKKVQFMKPTLPEIDSLFNELTDSFKTGMLTKGQYLERFEKKVSEYLGVRYAVGVSSCTSGLMLTCQALGLKGEVIVPSFTFMATIHSLIWNNLTPVFVDIEPDSFNLNPDLVKKRVTPKTSAIIPVHIFGNPVNISALEDLAKELNLKLIFDAAHGFGSFYNGHPLGRYGSSEVFSCSPTKLLVTGEGGIVATNEPELARRIRVGREYGNPGDYNSEFLGMNARMQEFSAILGLRSLEMLTESAKKRNEIVNLYKERLGEIPGISFQKINPLGKSSYKDFSILIDLKKFGLTRDELAFALEKENIQTRKYYFPPLHKHKALREFYKREYRLPVTEYISKNILSLPIYSHMQKDEVEGICQAIEKIHRFQKEIRRKSINL
ncbi:MAG: DegT/DnrJ/EryC1/StrS family aminotransferase [bacterium]|nr:DegT/DnrJ/EryC1/StrS family aminotransferase [bacterium]